MSIHRYLCLTLTFLLSAFLANAQIYDLNELRVKPDSNLLEVERPPLTVDPIGLSASTLDLRIIYWRHWTSLGINTNQASFSDNWAAGGVNSVSIRGNINHKSEYHRNNVRFVTEMALEYGKAKNKDQLPRKNNDRIFWDNSFSLGISKSWSLFTSLRFESQFDLGHSYGRTADGRDTITGIISNFMAPARITESFGIQYIPDNTFSLRFGTGTARQTLVLDDRIDPAHYDIEDGKRVKNDLAFELVANLDRNLSSNLTLKSRYMLFANYNKLDNPSHNLEATLTASVARFVNVTLSGRMLYDSDYVAEGKKRSEVQYSQGLAVGLVYRIP